MNWFFIALIGPILWSLCVHVDKYIISKFFVGRGVGSLMIFTSISGFIISFFVFIFHHEYIFIKPTNAIIIAISGAILVAAFIPYLHALQDEEASWVTVLYQLIPVFGYFLGLIFLNEKLTLLQILASLLVITGAVLISLDYSQNIKIKIKPLLLMLLSSFMLAVTGLMFKIVAIDETYWGSVFWEYIGGGIFGFLLLFIPLYRQQFFAVIKRNAKAVILINVTSELVSLIGRLAVNFASLLAPLVLVMLVNGLQPLIVFIYGVIITLFLPTLGKESLTKRIIAQKLLSIIIMFTGVYLLFK